MAALMPTTSSDLWLHWLKRMTDRHNRFYSDLRILRVNISLLQRILGKDDAQSRVARDRVVNSLVNTFDSVERFYSSLTHLAHSRTLKESLFVASEMLHQPLDIEMSPDCAELTAHCESMSIILLMLLDSLPHRGEDHPFAEVSGKEDGYRIFIAPNREERGADWPEMSVPSDSWYMEHHQEPWLERPGDWLTAIASSLATSGYSFTVRSKGSLSTFLIVYPRQEPV